VLLLVEDLAGNEMDDDKEAVRCALIDAVPEAVLSPVGESLVTDDVTLGETVKLSLAVADVAGVTVCE
jgi:hypothetical protein